MGFATHTFCAENVRTDTAIQEMKQQTVEAISKIQSLYDAGTPLFTKDAIRDLGRQLVRYKDQEVVVTGLNGVRVVLRTPDVNLVLRGDVPESELVLYVKSRFYCAKI